MNILIFGKETSEIENKLKEKGLNIEKHDPEIVVTYGGDGTFLMSENKHPEIPKLILKSSQVCKLCHDVPNESVLDNFLKGRYRIDEINKVEVLYKDKILIATNEIIVHNADPRHAIRYNVSINNGDIYQNNIIGDGIVLATQLGATGYYRSITDSVFHTGLGLAFNNSTEPFDHLVLNENSEIKVLITRGPARVYADNQEDFFELQEGDEITIKKSDIKTRIIKV